MYRGNILIVDDMAEARALMGKILRSQDFFVLEAPSGEAAVRAVSDHEHLDLVLLDIVLPDMSGYAVMEKLSPFKKAKRFKVCFVSGKKQKEEVMRAIGLGGDDYIVKPIFPDILIAKVNSLLGIKVANSHTEYRRIPCGFRLKLLAQDVKPDLILLELDEMNLRIRATADIDIGTIIDVDSQKLREHLKMDSTLSLKVERTSKETLGKYFWECSYVGQTDALATQIRALAIKGKTLD